MENFIKIIIPSISTFIIGIIITPFITNFLYRHKMWKKKSVVFATNGDSASITQKLHSDEERKTPRMGGIVVWGSVLLAVFGFFILSFLSPSTFSQFSFFSREQTWIPLSVFIATCLFGLLDDYLVCIDKGKYKGGGLSLFFRLLGVFFVALFVGLWFYFKLDLSSIFLLGREVYIGILIIPLFIFFTIFLYSGGIIDGVDGLSGGVFASMYTAYALIAFFHGQTNIAALCMSITGGILAFLWFNIPPARFFLSETGSMGLTITLGVIAFLTKEVLALIIIAFPLFITSLSSVIQLLSKRFRKGKKVFLVAPLHNHFQAIGWPAYKVTMRYWIISLFCSFIGVILVVI